MSTNKTYRVLVRMSEYRNVWVEAPNEAEAKRLVIEEDWYGPEFPCDNQTIDSEFGEVISIEETAAVQR